MPEVVPKPPKWMAAAGRQLWDSVLVAYELEAHEELLLREACRTADELDRLAELVERDGLLDESSQGRRAHPALTEARAMRITLARLLAALRLPAGDEEAGDVRRPQRRGPRGVYGPRGVA